MKRKQKVLIIIPAYNEEDNILKTYREIEEYNKKSEIKYDVIVINDGSTDSTEKILLNNNINHIKLINNLGIGGAVQTGYKYALNNDYDIAIQYDGDGQHDIKYAKDLIRLIINDECNMAIGSRYICNLDGFKSTKMRRVGISIISFFIKIVTGERIYDTTSGFRACNKKIINFFANSYPYEYPEPISTVKILKNSYKVLEVPVIMRERDGGVSSIKAWKTVYYMLNVIVSIMANGIGGKIK